MSQSNKKDIADFFRPLAKSIPRKRPNPDAGNDRSTPASARGTPLTPRADRDARMELVEGVATPLSPTRSLTTPKSGRSITIPIRSPSSVTPSALRTVQRLPSREETYFVRQSPSKPPATQSFSDIPSSNRTVFEDGKKVAVRDSDESDDSLESVSELIGRKNDIRSSDSSSQPDASISHETEGRQLLNLFSAGRSETQRSRAKLRELQQRELANKVDLSYIFADERKDAEARDRIAKLTAEEPYSCGQQYTQPKALAQQDLASVLKGSDEEDDTAPKDLDRLLQAVNRTEALCSQKSYLFLNNYHDLRRQSFHTPKFPSKAIPGKLFRSDDTAACDRIFLSGFMSDLAHKGCLDDDALRWTFEAAAKEQREDMLETYLACISAASSRWTRANIDPADVQAVFQFLGMDNNALQDNVEAIYAVRPEPQQNQYQLLVNALKLFHVLCEDLDFASLSRLCSIICRLLIDERTMSDNRVSQAARRLMQRLLDLPNQNSRQHVHERILSDMGKNVHDPLLQAVLLQNLIATTSSSLQLKTELATTFLLRRQNLQNRSTIDKTQLSVISTYLTASADFSVRSASNLGSSTFYTSLHALTMILDAAIGDGQPPATFVDRNEEQLFNIDVDSIAMHIHDLDKSIPDAAASHMTRTEAKNALQGLHHRLMWAVRTRRKKKRHVFDANADVKDDLSQGKKKIRFSDVYEMEEQSKKQDFMTRFLHKKSDLEQTLSSKQELVS